MSFTLIESQNILEAARETHNQLVEAGFKPEAIKAIGREVADYIDLLKVIEEAK